MPPQNGANRVRPPMPLYFRKSVSVGPFRFNLSGSGVGVSVGVPGFRVGSGPRGNYVRVGRGSVYYQHTTPRRLPAAPALVPAVSAPVGMTEIESASAGQIVDSSSEELLGEIRAKRRKLAAAPFAIAISLVLALYALSVASWLFWLCAVIGTAAIVAARYRDRIARTVVILYDLEPAVEQAYSRFMEWGEAVAQCGGKWHVAAEGRVHDRKYHAGASALVRRAPTAIRTAQPPGIATNVPVLSIGAGRQTLYFLPDKLLIDDGRDVGAVSYRTLQIAVKNQRFIEEGGVPRDATVVDHTWRYVNRNGGPDRRFNDNPRIPVCVYDELHLQTASGLNEVVQVSKAGIGAGFAAAVQHLAAVST